MRQTSLASAALWVVLLTAAAAEVPTALGRPDDAVVLTLRGRGVQIYECRAGAGDALEWTLKAPKADLLRDGVIIGRHYAGPTWELQDGSRITGKVEAKLDAPDSADIPWLRLTVATHGGEGAFGPVRAVLRINTRGGAKQGRCQEAGASFEAPYEADYVFVR